MRPADGRPVGLRNRAGLGAAVTALNAWNARHPWNHNDHYHRWLLRQLPARRGSALDVGCGRGGLLERLADRFDEVTGIDPDPAMCAAARSRLAGRPGVEVHQRSLLDTTGSYDVVTMVASLHHLPLEPALRHAAGLVAPGGRLLVVGLAQLGSPMDVAVDSVSLVLNPIVGMVKHPGAATAPAGPAEPPVPLRDPDHTFGELRSVARRVLPGVRVRRRLYFRYTLRWSRG